MRGRRAAAIIPAAGAGLRMGAARPKQYLQLGGRPILAETLEVFERYPRVDAVVLVVPPDDVVWCRTEIVERYGFRKVSRVAPGGATRQESVRLGLEAVVEEPEIVLIHDGVRPFVASDMLDRLFEALAGHRAVVPGLAPDETVKRVGASGDVEETLDRSVLRLIQTPQLFRWVDIRLAHERARIAGWTDVTDDAILLERSGIGVTVVEGARENIKITSPFDLERAKFLYGLGRPGHRALKAVPE